MKRFNWLIVCAGLFPSMIHEQAYPLQVGKVEEKITIDSLPERRDGAISGLRYTGRKEDLERALKVIDIDGFTGRGITIRTRSPTDEVILSINHPGHYNSNRILNLSKGLFLLNVEYKQLPGLQGLHTLLFSPDLRGNTFSCNCYTQIQFAGEEFFNV